MYPIQPHVRRRRPAFTPVELLVVIGIIAMLIGILLSALGRARSNARATACLSNLKQVNLALIMYAHDNHDVLPLVNPGVMQMIIQGTGSNALYNVRTAWYGGAYVPGQPTAANIDRANAQWYPPASPLYPYWGTANVGGCPELPVEIAAIQPGYGPICYAYNALAGHMYTKPPQQPNYDVSLFVGEKLSRVMNAELKAAVWDSIRIPPGTANLQRNPWGYPTSGKPDPANYKADPSFHGRHSGKGNVGWFDGHASAFTPAYFDNYGGTTADPHVLRRNHVGNIDDDGRQTTDEHYILTVDR